VCGGGGGGGGGTGSLHDLGGNMIVYYAWGMGHISNNLGNTYSLWMGFCIEKEARIKYLIFLGDSMLVIKSMNAHATPEGNSLSSPILGITQFLSRFDHISFFHIK
jgi:hypothetical protein